MATEERPVLEDLAELINARPVGERRRYAQAIRRFKHDIQNSLGLISTAEGLLERLANDNPDAFVDWELLEIIKQAAEDSIKLLSQIDELITSIEAEE